LKVVASSLASARRPKLGQHFLTSDRYRDRVVQALPLQAADLVIEIGAGRGAMTGLLAECARQVVAVELDKALANQLKTQFGGNNRVEIMQGDVLELDVAEICRSHGIERVFIFGNLPYYITSPILYHLLGFEGYVSGMAFVVQREVALRMAAKPGSRDYGYLSVLAQACTRPRVAFKIPPGAFTPPPAVFSALISFEMIDTPVAREDRGEFLDFVKLGFGQKRKKLSNNLTPTFSLASVREAFSRVGLGENSRAEELAVDEFAKLFELLKSWR
jgi:16S rRNA (adenine1518-N6/adenine1519-N6)-dimethyltransferase